MAQVWSSVEVVGFRRFRRKKKEKKTLAMVQNARAGGGIGRK